MPTDDRGRLLSDDGAWVWDAGSHQWLPHARQPGSPGPSVAANRDDFFAVERVAEATSARPNGTRTDTDWVIGGSATRPRTDGVVDPFAVSSGNWDRNGSDSGLSVTGIDVGPAQPAQGPTQARPGYGPSAQAPVAPTARSWPAQPSGGTAAEPGPQRPGPVSGPVRLGPVTGSVRVGGDPAAPRRTHPAAGAPTAWSPGPLGQTPGAAAGPVAAPLSAPMPAPDPAPPVSAAPNIFFTPARGLPVTRPGPGPSSGQPAVPAIDAGAHAASAWGNRPGEGIRASPPEATASPWRTPTVDGPAGRAGGFDPYPVARTAPPATGSPAAGGAASGLATPGASPSGVASSGSQTLGAQPAGARPPGAQAPGAGPSGIQAPAVQAFGVQAFGVQAPAVHAPAVRSPGSPASWGRTSGDPAQAVPGLGGAAGDPASSGWRTPVRPTAPPDGGPPGANGQWRRRTGSPVIDPRDPLGTGDLPSSRPITSARTGPPPQRPGAPASPGLPAAQLALPGTGGSQEPSASSAGLAPAPTGQPGEPRGQGAGRRSRRHGQNDPAARGSQHAAGDAVQNGASTQNGAAAGGAPVYGAPGQGAAQFGVAPGNPVGAAGRGRRGGAEQVGSPPAPVEMTSVLSRAIGAGRTGRDVTADPGRPPGPVEQPAEPRPRRADAPATDLLDPVRPGATGPATTGQPGRTGPRRHTAGRSGAGPGLDQGRDDTRRNGGPPADRGGAAGQAGGYRGGPGGRPDEVRPVRDDLADLLEPAIPADTQEPSAAPNAGPTNTRRRFATEDLSDLHDDGASRQASTARRGNHGDASDRLTWFRHGWLGPLAVAVTLALVALGLYVLVSGRGGGGGSGGGSSGGSGATTPPSPAGTNPDAKVGKALVDGTYICQAGPPASASATAGATAVAAGTTSVLLVPATTGTYTWNGQSGAYAIATPNYDDASNIIASVSFSSGPLQGDIATSIAGWPKGGGRVTATMTLTKGNTMFCKLN